MGDLRNSKGSLERLVPLLLAAVRAATFVPFFFIVTTELGDAETGWMMHRWPRL